MLLGTAGGEDWYLILLLSLYSNPLALRALPLYFAAQNTEEEGEMYFPPFASAPILYVTPRNAAGHGRGEFDTLFCCCRCFLTPPSAGHLPYILLRKTQGRCVRCISFSLLLRFYIRHLVRLLGTAGEEVKISFR